MANKGCHMSAGPAEQLRKVLPGIQLAVFEILWPAEPHLEEVTVRLTDEGAMVHCTPMAGQTLDTESCEMLLQEVFDVAMPSLAVQVHFGPDTLPDHEALMNHALFQAIATEVAPWRLEEGR